MDGAASFDILTNHVENSSNLVLTGSNLGVYAGFEFRERFSNSRIEGNHGAGTVGHRTNGTEFKAVTCKGEGRSTVAVRIVHHELGNLRNVEFHTVLAFYRKEFVGSRVFHLVEQFAYLLAEEARNDCRRCFIGTKTMGIGSTHDGCLQQAVVAVYTHKGFYDEHYEAEVVFGRFAGTVKQCAGVGRKAPVVVLTRTIDACKGFLVKEAAETVLACNLSHKSHEKHVVVNGEVALLKDRSKFKLVGSYLVVTRLARNAKFKSLDFEIAHELLNTFGNCTEVVVVHLLILGRVVTHKRTAGEQEVGTSSVETFVYEEVLLFPTEVGGNAGYVLVEILANCSSGFVNGGKCLLERSLVVESLTRITYEDGRNHKRIAYDEHGRCGIPCGIAASLKGGTDTAIGE